MGIIKHFSSSKLDKSSNIFSHWDDDFGSSSMPKLPNPDPSKYNILSSNVIGRYLILMIHYTGCTNYEGKKVLVFKDTTLAQLKKQKYIDPHFSDNKKFKSPIARFEPTRDGIAMAFILAGQLTQKQNKKKYENTKSGISRQIRNKVSNRQVPRWSTTGYNS